MSTAEAAPQIKIPNPEQQPPLDTTAEILEPQPVDEAQVALGGLSREVQDPQVRSERQQARDDFYSKLGQAAVSVATTGKLGEHSVAPKGFLQRRAALKALKKADKVRDRHSQQEQKMLVYPTTGGSTRIKPVKTFNARREAKDKAKQRLASGEINLLEYRKLREAGSSIRVYAGKITEETIQKNHNKALSKLKKSVKYSGTATPSGTSTPAVESTVHPPQPTTPDETVPATQAPQTPITETAPTQELTQAEKNAAVLAKMRDDGLLPPPTTKTSEQPAERLKTAAESQAKPAQIGLEELTELLSFVEAGVTDPELYAEIISRKANIRSDYYMSGGRPAYPGADDYVDQTRHDYYEYAYTDAEGKTVKERMSDELAKKILAFEAPGTPEPETAEVNPGEVIEHEARKIRNDVEAMSKASVDEARAAHKASGSSEPFDSKAAWAKARRTAKADITFALNKHSPEVRHEILARIAELDKAAYDERQKNRKTKR